MTEKLDPPTQLGDAGTQLWAKTTSAFLLDSAEQVLLAAACRTVDELARLDVDLAAGPLVVSGSKGQPVASPLLAEARGHRKVLDTLLRSLALPAADASTGRRRNAQQEQAAGSRHRVTALRNQRGSDGFPSPA